MLISEYLKKYSLTIEKFGSDLGLREEATPTLIFNPAIGSDLINISLLTDARYIVTTDIVPFDCTELLALKPADPPKMIALLILILFSVL